MVILVKSENTLELEKSVSDRRILGLRVISYGGRVIGRVVGVYLDLEKSEFLGVLVNRGAFREKIYIDRNYIEKISNYAVLLNINPVVLLRGLLVFDLSGRRIGRVVNVNRAKNTNALISIGVKRGIFSKPIAIPREALDTVNRGVIIKDGFLEDGRGKGRREEKQV